MFFNLGKGFVTLGLRLRDICLINMNSEVPCGIFRE